jgi:hypothetical protein
MKVAQSIASSFRRRESGASLVEVLISSTVALVVLGGLLTLVSVIAKEQRREMVHANLQQESNLLEDKVTRLIRAMSGTQAVILGDSVDSSNTRFRSILLARAPAPTARERLAFSPQTFNCIYTPSVANPSETNLFFACSDLAVLREMYFFIS